MVSKGTAGAETTTHEAYWATINQARDLFLAKLGDYGPAWHVFRLPSIIDQIYIKAKRIRRLEELGGIGKIPDTIPQEYIGIVNYAVIGLDKLRRFGMDRSDEFSAIPEDWASPDRAKETYSRIAQEAWALLEAKNHDYGEAWREMEIESLTDEILGRVARMKHMLRRGQSPTVSEHLDAQLFDTLNYAVLATAKVKEEPHESR